MNITKILNQFPIGQLIDYKPFGSGLINHTFLISTDKNQFILQKINKNVFKQPEIIADNLRMAGEYLAEKHPDYLFIQPLQTIDKHDFVIEEGEYWRIMPFVANSYSINEVATETQAYEAAKAFGRLTRNLHGLPMEAFGASIPGFHHLSWRVEQFEEAIANATNERKAIAAEWIDKFSNRKDILQTYEQLVASPDCPLRLLHHDTKINNVLFDKSTHKAVAVCDLDTLMPGRIISDIGDMHRTYLCSLSEESTDFESINVRKPFYEAIIEGYLSELDAILTTTEKTHLHFGGVFMLYMQGIRFLADFLNNDVYYPTKHPLHNLHRAINQGRLLEAFEQLN